MNEPTLDALARRAERLERQNRRLKLGGLVVLALLGLLLFLGAEPEPGPGEYQPGPSQYQTLKAEQFLMLDKTDIVRGGLWVDEKKVATLALGDKKGVVRAALRVTADGQPALELYSEKGIVQARLAIDSNGPGLELRDFEGNLVFRAP